jgi:endogenous inhibitor of DNA gyrase (YacG/DUF329 family)
MTELESLESCSRCGADAIESDHLSFRPLGSTQMQLILSVQCRECNRDDSFSTTLNKIRD